MKLKKCPKCREYSLKEICPKENCKSRTKPAHYKYIKIRSSEKN